MVFFFIADLALSFVLKATTWCLGKTYDGITYLVSRKSKTDNDDDEFVVISREDFSTLLKERRRPCINAPPVNPSHHAESVSVSVSIPLEDASSASSK